MIDMEKVIKALEFCTQQIVVDTCYGECPYAVADDDYRCFEMKQDALKLLKEQDKLKQLRCDKCSYHREDGWCGMHGRWVKETDYCSWGAWEGR